MGERKRRPRIGTIRLTIAPTVGRGSDREVTLFGARISLEKLLEQNGIRWFHPEAFIDDEPASYNTIVTTGQQVWINLNGRFSPSRQARQLRGGARNC